MSSPPPRSLTLALVGGAVVVAALVLWPKLTSNLVPVQADLATQQQRQATPALPTSKPERREAIRVASLSWGSGPHSLGHEIPQEGSPQGPMSFTVDTRGVIHALDTVNARILLVGGDDPGRSVPLPSETIDDLEVLSDGGYLALDRHITQCIHILTISGKERGRINLNHPDLPYPGLITAIFSRKDGIWIEVEHQKLFHVGDQEGLPIMDRNAIVGRFLRDGSGTLLAKRIPPTGVQIRTLSPSLQTTMLTESSFPLPVANLTALEPLENGGVALGVVLHRDSMEQPYKTEEVRQILVGFDARGVERWRAEFPEDEGPEENLRPVRLGQDGALYGMVFRSAGVEFWKVSL